MVIQNLSLVSYDQLAFSDCFAYLIAILSDEAKGTSAPRHSNLFSVSWSTLTNAMVHFISVGPMASLYKREGICTRLRQIPGSQRATDKQVSTRLGHSPAPHLSTGTDLPRFCQHDLPGTFPRVPRQRAGGTTAPDTRRRQLRWSNRMPEISSSLTCPGTNWPQTLARFKARSEDTIVISW